MKKNILGILRDKKYSPNHVENDAFIMQKTAEELKALNFNVQLIYESSFVRSPREVTDSFTMARSEAALDILSHWQQEGAVVVNAPDGIRNAYRRNMTKILQAHHLAYPKSILVDSADFHASCYDAFAARKVWLKSDMHSLHKEDVTPVYNREECETTVREFHRRHIRQVLLQEHKTGSEIKFYGVRNPDFFHWYYSNGMSHPGFSENDLKTLSRKLAEVLDLDIYGGDAIVSEKGDIDVIDFNDWPSFAPVKDRAGKAIARLISERIHAAG